MEKYETEFKLKVVESFLAGEGGAKLLARRWSVTDVTEFNVRGDKLYLSPIMDLYNGEIVAYEMQARPLYSLVGNMLKKALGKLKRRADAPLLHSDQGWHYQMADSYDNALAETINGLYKAELIHRRAPWKTKEAVELATLEWVAWFNNHRLLEPIGYIPPAEAEANYYRQLADQAVAVAA